MQTLTNDAVFVSVGCILQKERNRKEDFDKIPLSYCNEI